MRYDEISPVPPLTKATKYLIIACCTFFFIDFTLSKLGFHVGSYRIDDFFGLVPALILEKGWVWQFVTYLFLHGDPLHLLLNMMILWYFGAELELRFGERRFLSYYFLCGIGAGLFNFSVSTAFADPRSLSSAVVGNSGAIYGILAAYGMFYGDRYFLVFFLFPLKARYFVLLIAAIELFTGIDRGGSDNVAHFAHLGGMAVGAAYIWFFHLRPRGGGPSARRDKEKEQLKKKFTLIVNESGDNASGKGDKPDYWN